MCTKPGIQLGIAAWDSWNPSAEHVKSKTLTGENEKLPVLTEESLFPLRQ